MKNILITGAAGYLGNILYPVLNQRYKVIGIDNFMYGQDMPKFPVINADITSVRDMYKMTKNKDVVVALAGIVGDPACGLNEEETKIINLESTNLLVDVCEMNKVKKIIFASTCSVYGASEVVRTERSEVKPLSLYAETKLQSENILRERCKTVEPIILRFGTLFGYSNRMRFDLVSNIMTAQGYFNKQINVFGGTQYRPMVHIKDVSEVINKVIKTTPQFTINNVFGRNYTIRNIAEEVAQLTKAKLNINEEDKDKRNYYVSSVNLPYHYHYPLSYGIKEIITQFKKGKFKDYKKDKYYNVKILQSNGFKTL